MEEVAYELGSQGGCGWIHQAAVKGGKHSGQRELQGGVKTWSKRV